MQKKHIIIVGGGASGMMAAITAARLGAEVTIIEQKERLGKKILSTGNGKCNLTNERMSVDCFRGDDISVVSSVLKQFDYKETLKFFEDLGVLFKNRQGYIYPLTEQASTILEILEIEIKHLNIQVLLEQVVKHISKSEKGFFVETNSSRMYCDALILATGGMAAPVLGSNGSGYTLAKSFGHTLSPVVPALVQLKCKGRFYKQVAGVRCHATVSIFVDGEKVSEDTGELQLTNYGISGIPVFQVSRFVSKALQLHKKVEAEIDFLPELSKETLRNMIAMRMSTHEDHTAEEYFVGLFHKKLLPLFLRASRIELTDLMHTVTQEKIDKLISVCKQFRIEVEDTNGFEQAQICAGGIKTSELNPQTLESNLVKDLYITGEVLDVDGICGGYNLQWAWSTGYIAGQSASKGLKND